MIRGGGSAMPAAPAPAAPQAQTALPFVAATSASSLAWSFGMTRPLTGNQSQAGISTRGGAAARTAFI